MNYRNFFLSTAMVALLAAPAYSFASPMQTNSADKDGSGFYVKLQYNAEFFSNIGKNIRASIGDSPNAYGASPVSHVAPPTTDKDVMDYAPVYKTNYLTGGFAVGYSLGGPRLELEVMYSGVDVDDSDYSSKAVAEWLAFSASKANAILVSGGGARAATFVNDGFTNFAGLINAYFDFTNISDAPIVPYVGAGGGITKITFLGANKYAFIYQMKAGLGYDFTKQFKVFIGAFCNGVVGDTFKDVAPSNAGAGGDGGGNGYKVPATTDIINGYGMYGFEVGAMFTF